MRLAVFPILLSLKKPKPFFGEELTLHLDAKTEVKLDAEGNVEVHWEQDGEKGVFHAEYALAAAAAGRMWTISVWKT